MIATLVVARIAFGKADLTMALNGALAGLVAITAGPNTPSPELAAVIGAIGGVIVVFSIFFLERIRIDDPVGAISVHGVVGIWGVLAVLLSNPDATLSGQLIGIATIFGFVFVASLLVFLVIKLTMGLRISEEEELMGIDSSEIGVHAYPEFVTGSAIAGGISGGGITQPETSMSSKIMIKPTVA